MNHERWRPRRATVPPHAEGPPPSERARARLAEDVGAEIGLTRAAWQDALLRGDEQLGGGDERGALEALEDQRRILGLLEARLQRVVAAAAAERDAERILAGASPATPRPVAGGAPPDDPAPPPDTTSGGRLRALVAAGAAAAVTALAVGLAALVGSGAPPAPEVAATPEGPTSVAGSHEAAASGDDAGVAAADRGAAQAAPPAVRPAPWLSEWAAPWTPPSEDGTWREPVASSPTGSDDEEPGAPDGERPTPSEDEARPGDATAPDDEEPDPGPQAGDDAELDTDGDDTEDALVDLEGLIRDDEGDGDPPQQTDDPQDPEQRGHPEDPDGDVDESLSDTEAESSTSWSSLGGRD